MKFKREITRENFGTDYMKTINLPDLKILHKEGFNVGGFEFVMRLSVFCTITLEMLIFLVENGASLTETNYQGTCFPMNMAVYGKNVDYDILSYLLENGLSLLSSGHESFQNRLAVFRMSVSLQLPNDRF